MKQRKPRGPGPRVQELERQYGMPFGDLLREHYIAREMTLQECADLFGLSASTIQRHLERLGIPRRRFLLPDEMAVSTDAQGA